MAIDTSTLSDEALRNLIANHERQRATNRSLYQAAVNEYNCRFGNKLDIQISINIVLKAAKDRRFVSYKDLADANGAVWTKVRYAMNDHLGALTRYGISKGWPMLSAIIVNKENIGAGDMEPTTLKGFVNFARELGFTVTDEARFLRDQQAEVFAWAQRDSTNVESE